MSNPINATILSLVLASSLPTLALESDSDQPIKIQADAAMVDEGQGTSIYRGNVIIVQGTLQVTADEVEIYTADSEVIQIIAKAESNSNKLAHYEQQTNEEKDMVTAEAKKITYLVQEKRLHLSGKARLLQERDEFVGELLYYDLGRGIVNLNSGGGSERINMTINPKKDK
ncbi:MAG: lipopolysaccharide transport periplasmic protein LptA [Gammaproteobacteria bacterium]|jgi:lipopolysaccharide export system protein LptA|nr:lipopolysaccharide transport periplasmic protein LptA [Gammaproteobacteria bacterium]MBT4494280.1 lipopolysaccharide transport periplasmic protein LptA [Gammaproteobacteria bacterium]MBT7370889.1 lipopolysaccharide transport periplasmic protein LptA [Gammaproteobacteria bacterium]